MTDDVKPKRRSASAGIGELQLLRGPGAGAPSPPADSERPHAPVPEAPEAPEAPVPSAPPLLFPGRVQRDAALLRAEVYLPEELIGDVRAHLRPARTGHSRTLSVPLLLQAYVRAVDSLGLAIDVEGLTPGADDEAVGRVVAALEVWRCS